MQANNLRRPMATPQRGQPALLVDASPTDADDARIELGHPEDFAMPKDFAVNGKWDDTTMSMEKRHVSGMLHYSQFAPFTFMKTL